MCEDHQLDSIQLAGLCPQPEVPSPRSPVPTSHTICADYRTLLATRGHGVCSLLTPSFLPSHSEFSEAYMVRGWWLQFRALVSPEELSLVAQTVKSLPAMWETQVRSLAQEDPLEKEMATHSRILAWKSPHTEEAGGLQSMGSKRVGHDWATSLHKPRKLRSIQWLTK